MLRIAPKRDFPDLDGFSGKGTMKFMADFELADSPKESLVRDFNNPYLELVRLLKESSEIEHALMVQYLYACFSIKPAFQALAGIAYPGSTTLLGVAIQEMKHLHSVNKFLNVLGILPNLNRQDFPYEPDIYPFEFNLEPLSIISTAKYVYTESSSAEIDPDDPANVNDLPFINKLNVVLGGDIRLNHLGSLYQSIIDVAEELLTASTMGFSIQTNIEEMRAIKDQGEKEHFNFFKSVFLGTHSALASVVNIWDLPKGDANYPAFDLPVNPSGFYGHPNQIREPERQIAWLGNIHYWSIMLLLHQSYTDKQNFSVLYDLAKEHMLGPLYSLGSGLAQKTLGMPFDVLSLGYNIGLDPKSNLRFIKQLSEEGRSIADSIEEQLPESFSIDIYNDTIFKLDQILNA
jgi:hypothetical protein